MTEDELRKELHRAAANGLAAQVLVMGFLHALAKRGQLDKQIVAEAFDFADNVAVAGSLGQNNPSLVQQSTDVLDILESLRKSIP